MLAACACQVHLEATPQALAVQLRADDSGQRPLVVFDLQASMPAAVVPS